MQHVDLRIENYKQFVVKNESGAAKKIFISEFLFSIEYFFLSSSSRF